MNLIRYEPTAFPTFPLYREMEEMTDRLNRFFGTWTRPNGKELLTVTDWTPVVDIQETEIEYLVKAELARGEEGRREGHRRERVLRFRESGSRRRRKRTRSSTGSSAPTVHFERTFTVPLDTEETKVAADFKDGILKVHLPKDREAAAQGHRGQGLLGSPRPAPAPLTRRHAAGRKAGRILVA